LHFDYTTVGHVTVDVLEDGSRRVGGTALYSALQAARLGLRTLVVTQGVPEEVERLVAPFGDELTFDVRPASSTTTLLTSGTGSTREQRVLAWAGEIGPDIALDTAILHLAPVARETPVEWRGHSAFTGLTAQGLVRHWAALGQAFVLGRPAPAQERIAERCAAVVLSEAERESCSGLVERARTSGALVAITAGEASNTLLLPDGRQLKLDVPPVRMACDDLGAGDVFAAAFFIALHEGRGAGDAASFATAAAAVRVQGVGARAIADRSAIEARLRPRR